MSDLGDAFKVRHDIIRVTHALDINSTSLVINSSSIVLKLSASHKLGLDTKPGEQHVELVVCATVQMRAGHNVITSLGESGDGEELSSLTRRSGSSGNAAF